MKTYPLLNDSGQMIGFEISNFFFSSSASVARFFKKYPGVSLTRQRRMFERGNEIHAEFDFDGLAFVVREPYGDSSRFWIGPSEDTQDAEVSTRRLHDLVLSNWPGPVSKMLSLLIPWHR